LAAIISNGTHMEFSIIYEDENILVVDKPPGITVFPEGPVREKTLSQELLEKFSWMAGVGNPPRYGLVHRLDKDTSGILLVAKNNATLAFLQDQFKKRLVEKKYLTLAVGKIKDKRGVIETLIGRAPKDRRKQKAYPKIGAEEKTGLREAKTIWQKQGEFSDKTNVYTLLEVQPETGRKHQIRCHLAYLGHPVSGDKLYAFKSQPTPKALTRQFLHASYLKIKLPTGKEIEIKSDLPPDLTQILKNLTPEK